MPGIAGNHISVTVFATNAVGDSAESDPFGLTVANSNSCNIQIAGSSYAFYNGTFKLRNNGYVVRREDVQPYDGFYYNGSYTTFAYTPSAANDQTEGAYIILGPNQSVRDIYDDITIYSNANKWSYLVYQYDSDGGYWTFTEAFYNNSTSSSVPLGTWIANGGFGNNITVS